MSNAASAIRFGVFVPQGWKMDLVDIADPIAKYEAMTHVAQEADRLGYDSIWVYDHFHTVPTPELETTFECWSITAGLARDTRRVKIGQMVTCNGYRNPALLAKIASTVDVMSHGRLLFGLGAGWYEHEWRAFGYGFPETRERIAMFREACEIIHRMWTDPYPEFKGKYYTIDRAINEPKGVQQPHPPFWIGGGGEQVTLKLVARWGDACNFGYGNPEIIRQKLQVLRGHCEQLGRNYDEIVRSTNFDMYLTENMAQAEQATARLRGQRSFEDYRKNAAIGSPDKVAARIERAVEAGVNYVIVYIPQVAYELEQLQRFAQEVMPRFQ